MSPATVQKCKQFYLYHTF